MAENRAAFVDSGPAAISLCMIVRNEREHIVRCLESVRSLVAEIILVDTGSSDGTQDLAEAHGAKVITAVWEDNFSSARNLSIEAARSPWILVLDADEFLLEKDRLAIRTLVGNASLASRVPSSAFSLYQKSSSDEGLTGMLVSIIRLFPNRPDVRYEWPIHEQVATSLSRSGIPVIETQIEIIHTGYANAAQNQRKQQRNLSILLAQLTNKTAVSELTYFLIGGTYLDLGDLEQALVAYREAMRLAAKGGEIQTGSQVRIATCLMKLHRAADAIASMPTSYDKSWHPELLSLRGDAGLAVGEGPSARLWYERVLLCENRAFVPPCDLCSIKIEALMSLATYWKNNRQPALGLSLLRAALVARQRGEDFTMPMLEAIYREHDIG